MRHRWRCCHRDRGGGGGDRRLPAADGPHRGPLQRLAPDARRAPSGCRDLEPDPAAALGSGPASHRPIPGQAPSEQPPVPAQAGGYGPPSRCWPEAQHRLGPTPPQRRRRRRWCCRRRNCVHRDRDRGDGHRCRPPELQGSRLQRGPRRRSAPNPRRSPGAEACLDQAGPPRDPGHRNWGRPGRRARRCSGPGACG